jgi:outer membrane immunogenic protein
LKTFAYAGVALAVASLGGPALAADMPLKAPPIVPLYSWTGCHLGLGAGYESGHSDGYVTTGTSAFVQVPPGGNQFIPAAAGTQLGGSFNLSGFIGSAYAGCDYQVGAWVFGVEGDWSVMNKEGQSFIVTTRVPNTVGGTFNMLASDIYSAKERWLATARARLGYAITDKWLWYVTGGAAWMKIDSSEFNISTIASGVTQADTRTGWVIGGGFEYAVGYGWSIRSEYLYVNIPRYTTFSPGDGPGYSTLGWVTNLDTKLHDVIFRVGMSKKFDWWSPVVAKY